MLSGNLEIVGRRGLTKITSAPKSRHFTVLGGNELVLKWVNLTGGNIWSLASTGNCVLGNPKADDKARCGYGGSIYAEHSGLSVDFSVFHGNRAFSGGAIATKHSQSFILTNTNFTNNAGGNGGLRTVTPKGSLVTDRLESMVSRNMIQKKKADGRRIVQGKRRPKVRGAQGTEYLLV